MYLTFAEDFSSSVDLDSQLLGVPDSGLYWNRGVHPVLTVSNLLDFLPATTLSFADWGNSVVYYEFNTSRKKSDVVTYEGKIYQSLSNSNGDNQPDTSPLQWLETNIESLRIKSFIWTVEDNALAALSLNRNLIENQYIYNIGESLQVNNNDFYGWAFEPKGSDYAKIRINQISFQADTDTPQNLYVINQGRLIDTLTLNPNNGLLEFEDLDYSFSGKGVFYFIVDGQDFYSDGAYNDPLKYDGFVCYPVTGSGSVAKDVDYNFSSSANGLNFNVSCRLDSTTYIENNKIDLAKFYQTQFEYDYTRMVLHNANSRANVEQREQLDGINRNILATEALDINMGTVVRKYEKEKRIAIDSVNKTFDKFLHKKTGLRIKRKVL